MIGDIWNDILQTLERSLNPGLYKVWIKPLSAEVAGGTLKVFAPNDFVASWVRDRLASNILEAAEQVMGVRPSMSVEVRAVARPAEEQCVAPARPSLPKARPIGLPLVQSAPVCPIPKWRFSFDDFVVGPGNELAHAAARSVCRDNLNADHLFLSSGPGLGKTHLLHAVGRQLTQMSNKSHVSIACLSAEEFATRLVLAIRAGETAQFKASLRDRLDVLLLEDVHFFQGKQKMQDEILATLNGLQQRGCKVVLTSSFLPKELQNVDTQLVSRFCSGFLAEIEKPDFETRRQIVLRKAGSLGADLPGDVSELLAERITSDIRQLESCLNNLVLKAKLLNRQVSLEMAWDILKNYDIRNSSPDIKRIIEFVCRSYDLTHQELKSRSRKQQVVLARNTAFFLARKHTSLSLKAIGDQLGRRHSTVLKGITKVEREMSKQTPLGRQIQNTVERLSV